MFNFLFKVRTHVSGGEGDDGGGALVAEDLVGDGRHGVHVGRRGGGEVGATESGPQEGRHPVSNKIEYSLKQIVNKMPDKLNITKKYLLGKRRL